MNDAEALALIESELSSIKQDSLVSRIRILRSLCDNKDQNVARLAAHMLRYTERQEAEERFSEFVKKKAAALGKRPHQMVHAEVKLARREFESNEHE